MGQRPDRPALPGRPEHFSSRLFHSFEVGRPAGKMFRAAGGRAVWIWAHPYIVLPEITSNLQANRRWWSESRASQMVALFRECHSRAFRGRYVRLQRDAGRGREQGRPTALINITSIVYLKTEVWGLPDERPTKNNCFLDDARCTFREKLQNRLLDSLDLFEEITSNVYLASAGVILFLNKRDVFETRIRSLPLTDCFKHYTGIVCKWSFELLYR